MQTETKFFLLLIEYCSSAFTLIFVGPLRRIMISFFLLAIRTDELISAPNVITFLPTLLPFDSENLPRALNPVPQPECFYLLGSSFLANLIAPDKEIPITKMAPRIYGHKIISQTIQILTTFLSVKFLCISLKLPLKFICILGLI